MIAVCRFDWDFNPESCAPRLELLAIDTWPPSLLCSFPDAQQSKMSVFRPGTLILRIKALSVGP